MRSTKEPGFSIIELLIAVGIIGIIATIGINNYYNALHRSKQKRTMADIRGVALAWEARAIDVKQYNAAGSGFTMPAAGIAYTDLQLMLSPTYMKHIPSLDAWGNALQFTTDEPMGTGSAAEYALRSSGRDGVYQTAYVAGGTTVFDCDIVYANGAFVVYPEGTQQK